MTIKADPWTISEIKMKQMTQQWTSSKWSAGEAACPTYVDRSCCIFWSARSSRIPHSGGGIHYATAVPTPCCQVCWSCVQFSRITISDRNCNPAISTGGSAEQSCTRTSWRRGLYHDGIIQRAAGIVGKPPGETGRTRFIEPSKCPEPSHFGFANWFEPAQIFRRRRNPFCIILPLGWLVAIWETSVDQRLRWLVSWPGMGDAKKLSQFGG